MPCRTSAPESSRGGFGALCPQTGKLRAPQREGRGPACGPRPSWSWSWRPGPEPRAVSSARPALPAGSGAPAAHRGRGTPRSLGPGWALRGLRSAGVCVTELPDPAGQGLLGLSADFAYREPGSW